VPQSHSVAGRGGAVRSRTGVPRNRLEPVSATRPSPTTERCHGVAESRHGGGQTFALILTKATLCRQNITFRTREYKNLPSATTKRLRPTGLRARLTAEPLRGRGAPNQRVPDQIGGRAQQSLRCARAPSSAVTTASSYRAVACRTQPSADVAGHQRRARRYARGTARSLRGPSATTGCIERAGKVRDKPYASAREFRVSANAHMKKVAKASGRPTQEINREFVMQRFLARIFHTPDAPWVLKGGTGLLVRLPHARYSDDVDLLYPTDNIDLRVPLTELREAMAHPCGNDFFRFELGRVDEHTAAGTEKAIATVRVAAFIGATDYQRFSIDLSASALFSTAPSRAAPGTPLGDAGSTSLVRRSQYG
jgi:hypothetical protein